MAKTNFSRPDLVDVIKRIREDLASRFVGITGAVLRRSNLGYIARAFGAAVNLLHGHLDWIANQIIIDTCSGPWLERWASIWKIYRKVAAYASGTEVITATGVDTTVIPVDTVLVRSDGFEYKTTAEATIVSGSANLSVIALVADTDELSGNTEAGVTFTFQTPITDIDSSATVIGDGITGGAPIESDDELRARLLFRIQNPPRGGHLNDYIAWALEVPGVTRAWSYAHYTGIGKVGVSFMMDNSVPDIPSAGSLDTVAAYIETKRPATVKNVVLFAPEYLEIDMTIKLKPNTTDVQAAVEAEIDDYFYRWQDLGDNVLEEGLDEAISIAAGEEDHLIISTTPAISGNEIALSSNQLPKRGTITWQSYT